MTKNEYILKVLFSCRTLAQLEACAIWARKTSPTLSTNSTILLMALYLKK